MNPTQRERIRKHQKQLQKAAARKKARREKQKALAEQLQAVNRLVENYENEETPPMFLDEQTVLDFAIWIDRSALYDDDDALWHVNNNKIAISI